MAFIKEAMTDVNEPKAAPEGEYDLRIVKAKEQDAKSGRAMVVATIVIETPEADAPPFMHYLLAPHETDDEDQVRNRLLEVKRFCALFDVPEDFDAPDLVGKTAVGYLKQETGDDGVVRNRLVPPRLRD